MKEINRVKRSIKVLFSILLALFGVTSCQFASPYPGPCEYGTPTAEFFIKGTVKDKDGKPVKNIRITTDLDSYKGTDVVLPADYDSLYKAKAYTGSDGSFTYGLRGSPSMMDRTVMVYAKDTDGSENGGEFKPDSVSVTFNKKDFTGNDGHWYYGKATVTANISLTKK
jgi:putative lipoprotein (rSAM/lipoprotein system)